MQKAILRTLKDPDGSYAFPGGELKPVDLFCSTDPKSLKTVFINSAFTEFAAPGAGKIAVTKLTGQCGNAYVLASIKDLQTLQSCCRETFNKAIKLGCTVVTPVNVLNVLGSIIGQATTPTQYASIWNGDPNNALIGVLYVGEGWNFTISINSGSFAPSALLCDGQVVEPPVYVCPSDVVVTNGDGSQIGVSYTAEAHKAYFTNVYTDAGATNRILHVGISNNTNAAQNEGNLFADLASGVYYVEVREQGSVNQCTLHPVTVTAVTITNRVVQWDYFATDPTTSGGLGLADRVYSHSQAHVKNADFNFNVSTMPVDYYFAFRFPSDETNPTLWYNTPSNGGQIPDSDFENIVTIGPWKYGYTRHSISLDVTQPLLITHVD